MDKKLRVLVVDDSIAYRLFLRKTLASIQGCELVGEAKDGNEALEQIIKLKPDLVTLDIAMPNKGGIDVLQELQTHKIKPIVILLSSHTEAGNSITNQALGLGALDFVTKPVVEDLEAAHFQVKKELTKLIRRICETELFEDLPSRETIKEFTNESKAIQVVTNPNPSKGSIGAITIAISTGGPEALSELFTNLPKNLNVPILVVQHMPPVFTKSLAASLNKLSPLTVKEAEHGEILNQNFAYIAPGGQQMRIATDNGKVIIEITDDAPELFCKPSANYLFESIAKVYGGNVLAIVMTGLGTDGTRGLNLLHDLGATIFSQDEQSCAVWGMPGTAVKAGLVDKEIPLYQIAESTSSFIQARNNNESLS